MAVKIADISPELAKEALAESGFTGEVHLFDSVASTNDTARELAAGGEEEGALVIAGEQTGGRGRLDRGWHSPPGGLYLSLVLGPFPEGFPLSLVPLAAAVALAQALEESTRVEPLVKWPNDVIAGEKKLAGILAESVAFPDDQSGAVLGVGVNLNLSSFPGELSERATSVLILTGSEASGADLLKGFLARLRRLVSGLYRTEKTELMDEWRRLSATLGRLVIVDLTDGTKVYGRASDIDGDGGLIVETDTGFCRVLAGDVFHVHTQVKEEGAPEGDG